jgi:hypothetical protein
MFELARTPASTLPSRRVSTPNQSLVFVVFWPLWPDPNPAYLHAATQ